MIYGYARVSTAKQAREGFSLNDQTAKLCAAGAEQVITDVYTGTKMGRPNLDQLLQKLAAGDTLIVCKLDRFARTAAEGATIIKQLTERGVMVHVLNMGKVDDTPMGRLLMNVLLSFAEFERDMIVERTQTGKAAAREKGVKVDGRPNKYDSNRMNHAMQMLDSGSSYTEVERATGISKSTLIRNRRKQKAGGMNT